MILTNWKCGSRSSLWGRLVFRHFDRPSMKKHQNQMKQLKPLSTARWWSQKWLSRFSLTQLGSKVQKQPAVTQGGNVVEKGQNNLHQVDDHRGHRKIIINFYFTANLIQFTFLSKRRRRKEVRLLVSSVYLMIEKHKNSTPKGLLLTLHWIPTWKSKTNPKDQH